MTINSIKEAIVSALHAAGYRVHDEKINATHLSRGAVVYVSITPETSELYGAGIHEEKSLLVDCAYLESEEPKNAAMYDAIEDMAAAVRPFLTVGDRRLKPEEVRGNITDDVAHLLFNLRFNDLAVAEDEHDLMETLELKEDINNGNA